MSFPLLAYAAPGDQYLVDIGELVPVAAVSPRDAYQIAMTSIFGPGEQCPPDHPLVYQIDDDGKVMAVFE